MYGRNFSGGDNRTHGQVEQTPRIDSFDVGNQSHHGALISGGTVLDCSRYTGYAPWGEFEESVLLSYRGSLWSQEIRLTRVRNGFGGTMAFWVCPRCGFRFRFLYFKGRRFVCRECAMLNYRSQQETKDSMVDYRKGMALVEKHLTVPRFPVDGISFVDYLPEKPSGMHQSTYRRYLVRFLKYRERHSARLVADMMRLTRNLL